MFGKKKKYLIGFLINLKVTNCNEILYIIYPTILLLEFKFINSINTNFYSKVGNVFVTEIYIHT